MPLSLRNALALAALCLLAWLAYAPGLSGGFLFDDLVNLPALGATGPVDDWPTFWRYLTSGTADPTGRPLALLSFLLDARDWPADPAPFLRTNVLLHLLNGALLFALLRALGRWLDGASARTDAAALLGAGLWLLHPLLVSTTLYIVQREAMLPATFILLGLLAYVHGRGMFARASRQGAAWMLGGIGLGTLLAVLCKGNGILLPLLAWVLEATVLRRRHGAPADPATEPGLRRLRLVLLVVPSLLLGAWLASQLRHLGQDLDVRAWTLGQRLLTEPRVLLDYLQLLLVPRAVSTGLFNDGYVVSTGLLHPASTLPALLLVAALVALGFALRRRAPAWSAALLFFFAGHVLESSVLPLELYYEHRNYLPALLLFWPLGRALCRWRGPAWARGAVALGLLALCALTTWQRSDLWGRPDAMALAWARHNPGSPRAQAAAAMAELRLGQPRQALQRLQPLVARQPHELQLVFNQVDAACRVHGIDTRQAQAVAVALRHATEGHGLAWRWLDRSLDTAHAGACRGVDLATVDLWLASAAANPMMQAPGRRQDLHALAGRLALLRGQPAAARRHFDRALEAWITPGAAARQAALLGARGHYREGLAHLDHYRAIQDRRVRVGGPGMQALHQWVLERQRYWPRQLAGLRATLQADLDAQAPAPAVATPDSGEPG